MLQRDSGRSNSIMTISTGGIFLCARTSVSECSSIQIIFRGIFHSHFLSQQMGTDWVEFLTLTGLKVSKETTNTVVLVTNWVGEGELGMVTVFCHPS